MINIEIKHIHKGTEKKNSFVEYQKDERNCILTLEHFIDRFGVELIEDFKSKRNRAKNKNGIRIMKSV